MYKCPSLLYLPIIPLTGLTYKSLLVCRSPLLLMYKYDNVFCSPNTLIDKCSTVCCSLHLKSRLFIFVLAWTNVARIVVPSHSLCTKVPPFCVYWLFLSQTLSTNPLLVFRSPLLLMYKYNNVFRSPNTLIDKCSTVCCSFHLKSRLFIFVPCMNKSGTVFCSPSMYESRMALLILQSSTIQKKWTNFRSPHVQTKHGFFIIPYSQKLVVFCSPSILNKSAIVLFIYKAATVCSYSSSCKNSVFYSSRLM